MLWISYRVLFHICDTGVKLLLSKGETMRWIQLFLRFDLGHFRVRNLYDVLLDFSRYDDRRMPLEGEWQWHWLPRVNPLLQRWLLLEQGAWRDDGAFSQRGPSPTCSCQGILVMTSCNSVILFVMQQANLGWDWASFFCQWVQWDSDWLDFVTACDPRLWFWSSSWIRLGQAYGRQGTIQIWPRALGSTPTGWNW